MALRQTALLEQTARADVDHLPPPLKWAGGKRWLLPKLRQKWSGHENCRLVEPFAGGLSVALGLRPKSALLNDVNSSVINFYRHLQRGLEIEIHGGSSDRTFYGHRATFNELLRQGLGLGMHDDGRRAAMLFYYLNRHCFNGLCRFNSRGEFNTPNGKYARPKFERDLTRYGELLRQWQFTVGDFMDVKTQSGDFLYADPPYDGAYADYHQNGFDWSDQERLAEWLGEHDGPVVVSNYATPRIVDLYSSLGFDVSERIAAPVMISCDGARQRVIEILATRNMG